MLAPSFNLSEFLLRKGLASNVNNRVAFTPNNRSRSRIQKVGSPPRNAPKATAYSAFNSMDRQALP